MDSVFILLMNGFFLSLLLLILLLIMASKNGRKFPKSKIKIKDDLRKIKEQISE